MGQDPSAPRRTWFLSVILSSLLRDGAFKNWTYFNKLCEMLIGVTDSMTFSQLRTVMERAEVSLDSLKTEEDLTDFQTKVLESSYGTQHIQGAVYEASTDPNVAQVELPRSFTFLGQKFVMDSWVLGELVFDKVMYNGQKVGRRVPSSLDVAFAVFQNATLYMISTEG
eukprot:TRINITY_DN1210_c0_g1_i7.p1 TRINITY_DN1210_c0_g1~~TRINITY_DN1210_c0_g1_i7.p1  ORF type:complete len:188 (-),score=30.47 TRINITY_DN1210_c0_g1_i7:130-633(-)